MASVFPDPPKPMPDLVTVAEFAQMYRVDASVVRSWIKMGYINYVLEGPRKMRKIRKSDALKPIETAPTAPVTKESKSEPAPRPQVSNNRSSGRR